MFQIQTKTIWLWAQLRFLMMKRIFVVPSLLITNGHLAKGASIPKGISNMKLVLLIAMNSSWRMALFYRFFLRLGHPRNSVRNWTDDLRIDNRMLNRNANLLFIMACKLSILGEREIPHGELVRNLDFLGVKLLEETRSTNCIPHVKSIQGLIWH